MCRVRVTRARFKLSFRIPWMDAPRMCGVETACDPTQYDELTEQSPKSCFETKPPSMSLGVPRVRAPSVFLCTHSPHTVFIYYTATLEAGRDFDLPRHSHYSGVIPMVSFQNRFNIIVGGEILSF